jgi:Tfp pilus assembly protein PilF
VLFSTVIWDEEIRTGEGVMPRGFGGYCAFVLVSGALLVAAGRFEAWAAADDGKACLKESGDVAIEACTRAIKSKRYAGHVLARQYLSRGVEQQAKEDYDPALADFAEAVRIDKKYATAYYNRCAIYNFKKQYDSAITECSQAIKLGPSADATARGGSLSKDHVMSDYYAERGLAFLKKDDLVHAMLDLDNAIRLNPDNGRALKTRGLVYEAKGDTARAQADFAAAKLFGE